jgi:hypothetical protein
VLEKALREKGPLELIVQNNDEFKTHRVEYTGGIRYPHLVRIDEKPETLSVVLNARAK